MLFQLLHAPGSGIDVEQVVCRLREDVDVERLEQAWARVIARHDVLRTRFRWDDVAERVQEVVADVRVEIAREEWAGVAAPERDARLERWLAEDRARGFDLAQAPAMRLALFRMAADEHVLAWTFHHILLDGKSVGHVLHEVFTRYDAPEAVLPERRPFREHVAWLRGRDVAADASYWSAQLRGAGAPERVRGIRRAPRDPAAEPLAGDRELLLSTGDTDALRAFEGEHGVWLNTLVQGAWALLLGRYTGAGEAVFGLVRGGRGGVDGAEGMVGLLINTVPARIPLPPDARVADWLEEIGERTAALHPHEHAALADIKRWSGIPSDTGLFDSVLNFQPRPFDAHLRALGGRWKARSFRILRHPGLPLTLEVTAGERLRARMHYDAGLFDAEAIDRMLGHFARLLRAMVQAPDAPLARLPLIGAEEREALVRAGRAQRVVPVAERIEERFARRAAERPDAPAVTCGAATLTYRELDARAGRLAARLRARGVGPETRVGIALERSAELAVALLATLKAGGAYVPLDPAYPADRIAFVLEDAGAAVLVTSAALRPRLPAFAGSVICVDAEEDDAVPPAIPYSLFPLPCRSPDALAYVIYTSGSTGRPKGVQVTHGGVLRLFDATDAWFGFGADDVWTLFHSAAFDFSVWETWGALLHGGRLVVVPFTVTRSPEDFHRLLVDEGVTVLNQTPSAFRQLVEADRVSGVPADALRLRHVVFGGEALDPQALRPWMDRHGDGRPRLVNMYGITETTVHVTFRPITRADAEGGGSPIGVPIPDLALHLLDAGLEPVPPGVAGELFVGGAGVARGYLGRPALTAERFVPDPFGPEPGARLYRSGDRARRRADGEVDYLGRGDQQVKVRGFRIETGEIEAALAAHPGVAAAVAAAREDAAGERRLVAWVVARAGAPAPAAAALRAHLAASLPDYMVPAAFVALDAFPLTANGKLDRRALPAPDPAGAAVAAAPYAAPRTAVEAALAEAWGEVLGMRVGIDDDWFALGGDSIRSVRLVAAARRRGLALSIPRLYRWRTVRELAATEPSGVAAPVEDHPDAPFALLAPDARRGLPDDVEDAYPASRVQLAMLYHTQRDPASVVYQNLNAWKVHTRLDEGALREALRRLAARHPVLRTSFDLAASPEPVQRVHRRVEIPLEVADLRHLDAAAVDGWMDREKSRGFDWTRAPLLRFHAHVLGDDSFRLVLAEHHAILDGWSVASLVTELLRSYAAIRDGAADPAGAPPAARFRDFVALEREAVASAESHGFWRGVADDAPLAELPPREGGDASRADVAPVLWIELPGQTAAGVRRVAERAGVPVKTVLLAAHLRVLALLSGCGDVVSGYVTSGRPEAEDGERVLGMFLNTVPLRVRMEGGTWLELVRRTWEAEEAIVPHRRLPLAEIVREAGGRTLFEAAFNFNHFHVYEALAAAGVRLEIDRFFQKTEVPLIAIAAVHPATGALRLRLEHDPARLGEAQVRAIGEWYARALAALAADPGARWDADALLDADEDAWLRRCGTGPAAEHEPSAIHHLFERQARQTPDAIALIHDGAPVTYQALDERANRLAHALRRRGVGPEVRVGIHLPRTPELIAGMLAVLKAGGAYVPLDPAYPAERIAFMLEDSGAPVLVTSAALRPRLPAFAGTVLCVDDEAAADEDAAPSPAVPCSLFPVPCSSAAYVIYTSGSTGRPKGVVIEHRSAAVLLHWLRAQVPEEELRAVLGATSVCFDVSVAEIFGTLCRGGTLHLVDNALSLAALPPDAGILRATMVPSAAAELLRTGGIPPSLRSLGLGGEAVPVSLARELHALGTLERIENLYGPTEDTTYSTCWTIPRGTDRMCVGRPVAGTRAYVLDRQRARVPRGARGELYLAGAGLARGYLDRPALTAERFLPCPFGPPGRRMYRVGDQVRWTAEGELEYLDRLDHQVKVRGFRVEPGEVEEALRAHPAVADAAVAARAVPGGGTALAAYVAAAVDEPGLPASLRAHLAARLPAYMVPATVVVLDALPRTPNGKVDRRALPAPEREARPAAGAAPRTAMERRVAALWREVLGAGVGVDENFFDAGGDSLRLFRLHALLRERLGAELEMVDLFRLPTVRDVAARLDGAAADEDTRAPHAPAARKGAVAIVGMAGRFPGADGPAALWRALRGGGEGITRFTDEELRAAGVHDGLLARPEYVRARGALREIEGFDAEFFGMSPRDAEILDPQHRIFLECAWEAMEDAGRRPGRGAGRVGVFAGAAMSTYLDRLRAHPTLADEVGELALRLANDKDFVATRTAYELGLAGPAITVQTACSTSLVAVHLACRSLRDDECDMALAGGVSAVAAQTAGYLYQKGGIASPDGCCRAFDADAQGTVPASGCGIVVLKRLEDALADGDPVHAVILGSAVNNDGDRKVGFTAPGVEGQAAVIRAAHAAAAVDPATIGYVEAHGTGTALGDPVEVAALADAFGTLPAGSCALGALKASVGHLDTAAGVAGLIKTVLALQNREIPPTPHFRRPNPQIGFERTPFFVASEPRPWTRNGTPRRAGVSSFGIGGTNAHVVLEEAPPPRPTDPSKPWQLLLLSARTPEALDAAAGRLADHLAAHPELPLADVAFTLREGRRAFPCRRAVVVREGEDAAALLRGAAPDRLAAGSADEGDPSAVFLFPGVGEQYPGMGRGLYETEPVFREAVDRCADILQPLLGFDLRETLFAADDEPDAASGGIDLRRMLGRAPVSDAAARLSRTEVAQPVLFVVGYALARLWESWGIRPAAVLGHSLGEYTAACVAGVFSLEDALELVAARARAIQSLPGGAMLAVPLSADALAPYLAGDVALAAVNAPELCVLAGGDAAIARVEGELADAGHAARRLAATHAFHSPLMQPVAEQVRAIAARMRLSAPRIPMISNVTGTWLSVAQATDPGYWADHLLGTVQFARGAAALLEDSARVWIEAGPGGSLGTFVRQQARADGRAAPLAVASLPHAAEGVAEPALLLGALGRLWAAGVQPDWAAFRAGERRRRVPLPTYPFQRTRHWVDLPVDAPRAPARPPAESAAPVPIQPAPPPAEDARARLRLDTPYAPPRDDVERALAAAWERLLGVRPVGIHDDFFRLGGHSLLGIRLMAGVRQELGADLPPQALFRAPTVAGMAAAVVEARLAATDQETLEAMLDDVRQLSPEALRELLEREPHNEGTAGV
jgi:amino acid adenylation domain-containing protein